MSNSIAYKSIPIPGNIPLTQRPKNAFAAPKVSLLDPFPRVQTTYLSWSGFRTSLSPVTGNLTAPKCNASVVTMENNASVTFPTRPSPAETCRTVMELCSEGTLCTLTEDGWPFGTGVEFALDVQGMPVLCFDPLSVQAQHVLVHKRCSLHAQLEQPGHRKAQCILMGTLSKPEDKILKQRLQVIWARRFGKEVHEDHLYVVSVEKVLQSQDLGEEGLWVDALEYSRATADPLRDCVAKIVKDMNDKHWEDIHRICNIYTDLDVEVEEASMVWIDRLGFDLRLLTRPQREILEVRIPFPREVTDEKDARSSLTYMAQLAWEVEKNYAPPEFERVKCIQN
uniref:DUF2470 domain-containing protein n=1 Tax=Araucaria cunninghamii TaxID=56994 RepID=A0A0D6R142_ARACU